MRFEWDINDLTDLGEYAELMEQETALGAGYLTSAEATDLAYEGFPDLDAWGRADLD